VKRFRSQCSATLAAGREPNGVATNRITGRLAPCRYCGRAVPDGSRRAAFVLNRRGTRHADGYGVLRLVGALDFLGAPSFANDRRNRTARAVPLLWEGLYRTARAMPLAWEAARAIMGAIGRIPNPGYDPKTRAPNEPNHRTARAVPLMCRTGAVHGTPMAMECSDLSELWISLGLRASRTTGRTGRLAPCRFCVWYRTARAVPLLYEGLYRTAHAVPLA
jgi:hypothetical protein